MPVCAVLLAGLAGAGCRGIAELKKLMDDDLVMGYATGQRIGVLGLSLGAAGVAEMEGALALTVPLAASAFPSSAMRARGRIIWALLARGECYQPTET